MNEKQGLKKWRVCDLITCKRWKKLQHLFISRQAKRKLSIDEIALVVEDWKSKAPAHLTRDRIGVSNREVQPGRPQRERDMGSHPFLFSP